MERHSQPIGFMIKKINNVYEKELNEKLRQIGADDFLHTVRGVGYRL